MQNGYFRNKDGGGNDEFSSKSTILKGRKEKNMKNSKKILCIALVLILLGSIGAAVLQTDFGSVKIKDITILTEEQQSLHALAFIPKNASAENKVPVVVTSHGWLNSAEVQDATCIELSRRGIMVIAMDAYNHGFSSSGLEKNAAASAKNGLGMVGLVKYVASGVMDYVDLDRIGVMGHSMGGGASADTLVYFSKQYDAAIEAAKAADSEDGETITEAEQAAADAAMPISAALPTGMTPNIVADWSIPRCNTGIVFTDLDENGYLTSVGTAKVVGDTVEALNMVKDIDPSITYVEEGKYYGSKEDGTLRVLYQPHTTHPLLHFDKASTEDIIEFFTYCFDVETNLSNSNQIFMIKEIFNLVAMVGLFMLLVPVADLLMSCPCFAELRGVEGPKVPACEGEQKKKFWFGWVLCGVVSFVAAYAAIKLAFVRGGQLEPQVIFAAPTMGYVGLWTLISGVFLMFWFWFNYKKDKAAGIRNDEMIGWKISGKELLKSIALAATVLGLIYVLVWFCKWAFNTDFRFWTPAVKTFNPGKLVYFFIYLPPFVLFYLANSLMVNGACRFEGMNEKKNLFILGLGNILGCVLIWAIQYGKLILTGSVLWGKEWIGVLVIAFCVWQLFLAPYLLRKFYKITGKNWLGPIVVSSMYVLMSVTNTAIHSAIV